MAKSQALQKPLDQSAIIEKVITKGDLADLTPEQRMGYYHAVCQSLKLNTLTKPFDFLEIYDSETKQKKIILYANKDCAAQLRERDKVSISKIDQKEENGYLKITVYASLPDGKTDIDISVIMVKGLMAKAYENACKKAVTQAKRRVTLSICGLGFLDESEIESVPGAKPIDSEAVMTLAEQETLTLKNQSIGLDQWACGRAPAMQIITLSTNLKSRGMTDDIIKSWLPSGIESRKDLDESQARDFIENLTQRLKLVDLCAQLASKGIDNETMRMRLPGGVQSLASLTLPQTIDAIKIFTRWLNDYNEAVEGTVIQ
jgi:hypothetical protein